MQRDGKIPVFTHGKIQTETPVQFGCLDCLDQNLEAPAEGHVIYTIGGNSFCATHARERLNS